MTYSREFESSWPGKIDSHSTAQVNTLSYTSITQLKGLPNNGTSFSDVLFCFVIRLIEREENHEFHQLVTNNPAYVIILLMNKTVKVNSFICKASPTQSKRSLPHAPPPPRNYQAGGRGTKTSQRTVT